MLAAVLSLLAAASWGVADFVGGLKTRTLSVITVLLGVETFGLLAIVPILLAAGEGPPDTRTLLYASAAGLSGITGLAAFYRALAVGTMSVVAPVAATGVVLPVTVGLIGGDRPSALQGAGLVLAVVGVVLASREAAEHAEARSAIRRSIGLALLAALGFGGFFVLSDVAADGSVLWTSLMVRTVAIPVLVAVALAMSVPLMAKAPHRWHLVGAGLLDAAAGMLYALALTEGLLSIVSVIGSLYPVMTVLLARTVLGERLRTIQAAGVVLALAGVALIAGG